MQKQTKNSQPFSAIFLRHLSAPLPPYILLSFLTAHPLTATTTTIHAINSPTSPIVTV